MAEILVFSACAILTGLAVFQFSLVLGAPLGKYAWGGSHKILPLKLRIGSLISIFLYSLFAFIILDKADIFDSLKNENIVNTGVWILTIYFLFGTLMNSVSRSKYEKFLMTPVSLILALLFFCIARS
jgi:hypothetical protein